MRLTRRSRTISFTLISPETATRTIAARTALGRLATRPVRKRRQSAIVPDATRIENGVFAPDFSLTADCERPPATG